MVISKVHKIIIIILSLFIIGGFLPRLSVGYSMYLGKSFVGNVHSHSEAEAILDILSSETGIPEPKTSLYLKLLSKNSFDAPHSILTTIQSLEKLETEVLTETVTIPFETTVLKTDTLFVGEKAIKTEGKNGMRTVVKSKTLKDGKIIKETVISDRIEAAPVTEVISEGTKPRPEGVGTGSFSLPLSEIQVSSYFGPRWNRKHAGIDFAEETGAQILAADSGTVIFSGVCEGYGNLIIIDHKNSFKTYYAHASVLYAKAGTAVHKGEVIAEVGSTGNSTGPHLHFEIRKDDVPQDPADYLPSI